MGEPHCDTTCNVFWHRRAARLPVRSAVVVLGAPAAAGFADALAPVAPTATSQLAGAGRDYFFLFEPGTAPCAGLVHPGVSGGSVT